MTASQAPLDKEILLAEDEDHISKLVSFKLVREGFKVTIARNGQEAIDQLPVKPWSLIILDVMMPICDGWQVLKSLRALSATSKTPVLMLTAKGIQKDLANAAQYHVEQYLKKPFDPTELADVVKRLTRV